MSDELIDLVLDDAKEKMDAAAGAARREFSTVRTGRASSALFERLTIEAYGVEIRLLEVASFSVPEARQLIVTPHDPSNLEAIERSIIPPLTEERRRDYVKIVGGMAEEAKQRVNGVRRSARKELDDLNDDGGVSEDDVQRAEGRLDSLKDEFIGMIDAAQAQKEEELLEV